MKSAYWTMAARPVQAGYYTWEKQLPSVLIVFLANFGLDSWIKSAEAW